MRLGTCQECVGSSLRVLGAYQDGAREFARRRPKLVGRLSGVAEKLAGVGMLQPDDGPGSCLGIGPGSDDAVGSRQEFARRITKEIGKLAGNTPGDRRKESKSI
ncbi:hypothetical protein BHE74_00021100 [Ensete ventricosum]|nr:hypothetical protein BHE74_00021100 [Ensete ventricosum]